MCGRFAQGDIEAIFKKFKIEITEELIKLIKPRYNIAPAQDVPIIVRTKEGKNQLKRIRWGLIPFWAKEPSIGYKFINARSETVSTKPSFRKAFLNQRCIVPATGFYEWMRKSNDKVPFFFVPKKDKLFSFAGIYDIWKDVSGMQIVTFAILTTEANDKISEIHDRMPVILEKDEEDIWLDPNIHEIEALIPLFDPFPASDMQSFVVSRSVNSPRNDSADLIKPVK